MKHGACGQCGRSLPAHPASDGGGLCGRCHRLNTPVGSLNEKLLTTPVDQLDEKQKHDHLMGVLYSGNEARLLELLNADTRFLSRPPSEFTTWLGEAISCGCSRAILEKLIQAGCDPNSCARSPDKTTPLEVAVSKERCDAISFLLESGADPNLGRPIICAMNQRVPLDHQLRMLRLLLDGGADVHRSFDLHGDETARFTVLDWCFMRGSSTEVIRFLQERGAKSFAELGENSGQESSQ